MNRWTEIKTAYQVARSGTISAAAEALGVHRATVLRHIDLLEKEFGEKLFQRNARGYVPTEAGLDLMRVAQATDEQFSQLLGRTRGRSAELSGEFIVTSLSMVAPALLPALKQFQENHPKIIVRYLTSDKLFKLEYGEAHIAVRTGPKPDQPDNVVQPFMTHRMGMFAHKDYVAKYGIPTDETEFSKHTFIGLDDQNSKPAFHHWMLKHVPAENVVFRYNDSLVGLQAVLNGVGIAFMLTHQASSYPDLVQVFESKPDWDIEHWLVTHGSLHRSPKVQAFLAILKAGNTAAA